MKITQDEMDALIKNNKLYDLNILNRKITVDELNENIKKYLYFGYDCISQFIIAETRAKRLGVYGKCKCCKGTGKIFLNQKIEELYNAWDNYSYIQPPIGEGYQLWSTTIDGPISPVFRSIEELARYCTENKTVFADYTMSYDEWYRFIFNNRYTPIMKRYIKIMRREK